MLLQNTSPDLQIRLHTARRIFSLLPLIVFLLTLIVFSSTLKYSYLDFLQVVLQATAVSLASSFVSIGAYGFYCYLTDRSPGL